MMMQSNPEPINGDAFRAAADAVYWCNDAPRECADFRHGDVVFCKIDEAWRLFRALRRTRKRIVLITGEGDKPVDAALWRKKPRHVFHWFGTNMFVDNPRCTPIPLGIGNANGRSTLPWGEIVKGRGAPVARTSLLYANFSPHSNPAVREPILRWLKEPEQTWITHDRYDHQGKGRYLESLRTHHFVLCPPGNGEDSHRLWEALYCGAIPVARSSVAMRAFRDLPILFVNDFFSLSEKILRDVLANPRSSDRAKLCMSHWAARIREKREQVRAAGPVRASEWVLSWCEELARIARRGSASRRP